MTTRRSLIRNAAGAFAAGAFLPRGQGANERVVVAVMGIHDRGMDLAREFAAIPGSEIAYLIDPDSRLFDERANEIADLQGTRPQCVQDFRRVLDDPDVDAIAIATPDHWHALGTVMACQAGKDVYVEKPVAHNIREGRAMVKSARKYDRVVQVGTQNRSADYCYKALDFVRSGGLGNIHFCRVVNSKNRERLEPKPDAPTPEGVDYDLWLGPTPSRPFNENHFHYNWHWFWRYSGGDIVNDGVHQIDLARWLTGKTLPQAVSAGGGRHVLDALHETPDTLSATWEFDDLTMVYEQTLWTPYMKKNPFELRDKDSLPNWPFSGTRIEIYGTKNMMFFSRMGGGWQVVDGEGKTVAIEHGRFSPANTAHVVDFLDRVRDRKRPHADIEEGHRSTLLCHYGNIAYRTGRRLRIDPETEGFVADDEANRLAGREYRSPWSPPEVG